MNAPTTSPSYRPAGIVTRSAAAVIDLVVVIVMGSGVLLGVAAARFVWSPLNFQWPAPSWTLMLAVGALIATAYLTIGWVTTGRTFGLAVFGLRVLSARQTRLGWAHAVLRAGLCLLFPPGLLWVVISKRRHSLQDAVLFTVVVYDWSDDAGLAAKAALPQPAIDTAQPAADERQQQQA